MKPRKVRHLVSIISFAIMGDHPADRHAGKIIEQLQDRFPDSGVDHDIADCNRRGAGFRTTHTAADMGSSEGQTVCNSKSTP